MNNLKFGIGGFPRTMGKGNVFNALGKVSELGLDAMELEFTRSVFLTEEKAMEVNTLRKKLGLELTVHGSYFVNLAALEDAKQKRSIGIIVNAAKIGALAGAKSITFHPAFYLKRDPKDVYAIVEKNLSKILKEMSDASIKIDLSPELTGKPYQLGNLDELIDLAKDLPGLRFCIDFAHNHARNNGGWNTYDDFMRMLEKVSSSLGLDFLSNMHMHVSGIEYGEKGEKNHVVYLPSKKAYVDAGVDVDGWDNVEGIDHRYVEDGADFDWKGLMKALKASDVGGILTCESPNLEQDALLMKQYYMSL